MKPAIPQGTRDFDAITIRKRQYIINVIKNTFELYGFQPLETPAMENLQTLIGKYGDEGDKLIFKILNNGLSDPKNTDKAKAAFENVINGKSDTNLTERALRYDLTIPFARYVAMNHGQLSMPFKRYQIQPVWRADRPQKGRYREFYQCDADVVGSNSLLNEAELAAIYYGVFATLKLPVVIKINNRKILAALAELCGGTNRLIAITTAIDKLDKIGIDKVKEELVANGIGAEQITIIETYLNLNGSNNEKIEALTKMFADIEIGKQGLAEINTFLSYESIAGFTCELDVTLARGLNYYTGIIYEVKATTAQMGSIGGGGRYNDLTGLFGVPNIPGVGISFGLDRIYDVLDALSLFPEEINQGTKVLFFNLGQAEAMQALTLVQQLRHAGIAAELYHETAKFDKQFKYAERKQIPMVAILGAEELAGNKVNIKNLSTGEQVSVAQSKIAEVVNKS
jgi:histidyl-tRNA synthetase